MFPDLGQLLGGLELRSYGVLSAVGLVIGVAVVYRSGARAGLERSQLIDLILWVVVAALLGAKLTLLLVNFEAYAEAPWDWVELFGRPVRLPRALLLWRGGLVYYGGVIGGGLALALYLRRRAVGVGRGADLVVPGLALGHVWGRMGCLLAGCCFGKAAVNGRGLAFGPESQAYEVHASMELLPPPFEATYPLHPTQLYEAVLELVIAAIVLLWLPRRRRWSGQIALSYLILYSIGRFLIEMLRGDRARGFIGEPVHWVWLNRVLGADGGSPVVLSVSQLIAVLTVAVCCWLWLIASSRHRRGARGSRPGDS